MASPARHLRVVQVDSDTGEVVEHSCSNCASIEHEIQELVKKMRGLARELGAARADKDAEAREHAAWPKIVALFKYWQEQTGHKRVTFTEEHFWMALPKLKAWGPQNLAAAIAGLAYDPYRDVMKNGKPRVYNDWETLFKPKASIRRYIEARPSDWVLPPELQR